MKEINLRQAVLIGKDISGADLRNADLRKVNLQGFDFTDKDTVSYTHLTLPTKA